jgi:hypothetical protein
MHLRGTRRNLVSKILGGADACSYCFLPCPIVVYTLLVQVLRVARLVRVVAVSSSPMPDNFSSALRHLDLPLARSHLL